jgi:hypothetical protein
LSERVPQIVEPDIVEASPFPCVPPRPFDRSKTTPVKADYIYRRERQLTAAGLLQSLFGLRAKSLLLEIILLCPPDLRKIRHPSLSIWFQWAALAD